MGARSDWKKQDKLSSWDLDKGCRRIVDQTTPGRRRLKMVLRRQARKKIYRRTADLWEDYDFCHECRGLGNDYVFDKDGELVSYCDYCSCNPTIREEGW